jgi:hypothetical protein
VIYGKVGMGKTRSFPKSETVPTVGSAWDYESDETGLMLVYGLDKMEEPKSGSLPDLGFRLARSTRFTGGNHE